MINYSLQFAFMNLFLQSGGNSAFILKKNINKRLKKKKKKRGKKMTWPRMNGKGGDEQIRLMHGS